MTRLYDRHTDLDLRPRSSYVLCMATVLSTREQSETGDLARRLGGYDEMLRLEAEMANIQKRGGTPKLQRDPKNKQRYIVVAAS